MREMAKRVLAVVLVLVLCVGLFPMSALAEETAEPETIPAVQAEETEAAAAAEVPVAEEPAAEEAVEQVPFEEPAVITLPETEAAAEISSAPTADTQDGTASYTITYYKNDGYDGSFQRKQHGAGERVSLSEVRFSRNVWLNNDGTYAARYTLSGWNTARDGSGESYSVTDTIAMPAEDMSLYAVWTESEQVYWEVFSEGHGQIVYPALKVSPGSEEVRTAGPDEIIKVYVSNSREVYPGTIHGFEPVAEEGYVFDGWYLYGTEKLDVTKLGANQFPTLTNSILEAGTNRVAARFVEDTGFGTITYRRDDNGGTVYFQQTVALGAATPLIPDPTYKNHFFRGWSPAVAATVTGDATYTAQWLEGPTVSNTAEELFTIRCVSGPGYDSSGRSGSEHEDMTCGFIQCTAGDDIAWDAARGVYTSSIVLDRLGVILGVGPGSYAVLTGQEHYMTTESYPVIRVYWDSAEEKWVPDGEQIVEVRHEMGFEAIDAGDLAAMSPILCVTDSADAGVYKKLRLLEGSYEISEIKATGASLHTAVVTITDFDAYARQLGENYVPDWEHNLHGADYYCFYLVNELKEGNTAAGYPYYYWSGWKMDRITTAYQSIGGVAHNEFDYGKELLVKKEASTWSFTGFSWTGSDESGYTAAAAEFISASGETRSIAAELTSRTEPATCETAGSTVYTAVLGAGSSPDGAEHSEAKTVVIAALGHAWGEPVYTWAEDNSTVTAVAVCANDSTHRITETVAVGHTVYQEAAYGRTGEVVYYAEFENEVFTRQVKTAEIPAVAAPAALTAEELAAAGPVVNVVPVFDPDSAAGLGFLPESYAVQEMETADGTRFVTTVSILDLAPYVHSCGEGFYIDLSNSREEDGYGYVFSNTLTGSFDEGYAWSGWVLDEAASGYLETEYGKGKELRVSDLYTITYDHSFTSRYGEVYDESPFYEQVASLWAPVQLHYGDPIPALDEAALASIELFASGDYVFDAWSPEVQAGDTVHGDMTFVAQWIFLPDVCRYDPTGSAMAAPSKAENLEGDFGKLVCLTDEGHSTGFGGKYLMPLVGNSISNIQRTGDTWTCTIELQYNVYVWNNPVENGGFMPLLVQDGIIAAGHMPVTPLSVRNVKQTIEAVYNRETGCWYTENPAVFELYCGYKVTYRDENGETLFYVRVGGSLPAYEGNTERDDAIFLGWFDNHGQIVEPGDESYIVTGNTTVTATFLPYPDAVGFSNLPGTLFRFDCMAEELHSVPVDAEILAAAGVQPVFGEIGFDAENAVFTVDLTLSAEDLTAILACCEYRDGEALMENRHELCREEELTVTLQFLERSYNFAHAGFAPLNASDSTVSSSNVLYGYWGLDNEEEDAQPVEIRCAYFVTMMDAAGNVMEDWCWPIFLNYYDYDSDEYIPAYEEDFSLTWLPTNQEELEAEFGAEFVAEYLTREGCEFVGWGVMDEAGKLQPAPERVTEDLVLYPRFLSDELTINKTSATLLPGETDELQVTDAEGTAVEVSWTSTEPEIAEVDANGKVTAIRAGLAEIQALDETGEVIGTCTVRVLFTDVADSGKFYYDSVYWALDNGITTGLNPTTFAPNAGCTREQTVTFLWRLMGSPTPKTKASAVFKDVRAGSWYEDAVGWAIDENVTTGLKPDQFGVGKTCTREQFVTFLWRAADCPEPTETASFVDLKAGAYYVKAVSWALENGVTTGLNETTFGVGGTCTRGQVVTFLKRFADTQ